eukprot:scaffold7075_cov274-Pinguiococcus_pyrenoidosus.AAC.23
MDMIARRSGQTLRRGRRQGCGCAPGREHRSFLRSHSKPCVTMACARDVKYTASPSREVRLGRRGS